MADERAAIEAYFAAMRRGGAAEDEMMALFTSDASYEEPFSGSTEPAVGEAAIRARFRVGWEQPLPDLQLDVLSVEVVGAAATSRWECRSPALPGVVRGTDRYEFRDGQIAALQVTIDPPVLP